jgi:predicted DNA-binding protein YlxM (UPF0122 family)
MGEPRRVFTNRQKGYMKMLHKMGLSYAKIGRRMNCSRQTVFLYVKKY